ncbi:MAG: pirin family protein [Alphaproteobacteria bacterium]|nr:pirin family protein [Alphaproteobacteria bacterium]
MITVRKADERGATRLSWLDSKHSFSFADYHDPAHMGFRALRVINDDKVAPAAGFGMHGHRDMEILTYVLSGALKHRDSMGNGEVIRPGDVQVMSAGTGIMHSEINPSRDEPVHLLQIWMLPKAAGLAPRYEQKAYSEEERRGRFRLVGSPDGREGSVVIHQDLALHAAILGAGETATLSLAPGRHAWLQVATGQASVNGIALAEGDGAAVTGETLLTVAGGKAGGEVLAFDLA